MAMKLKRLNSEHISKAKIKIPNKLPLLESLCWNIHNPYSLSPKEMLSIYEERWHFKDVLGRLNQDEGRFIRQISTQFQGLPLIEMNDSKEAIFTGIETIISKLDANLFHQHQIMLGGGALIGILHQQLRYSSDLDFLVAPENYNQLRYSLRQGKSIFTSQDELEIGSPRIDRYGIRYPIRFNYHERSIALKLEIVAEWNLKIDRPEIIRSIPCLNLCDRITAKLLTNVDRGADRSKFSRDLIDLAIIATQTEIPIEAIEKAQNIYPDTIERLTETIALFQRFTRYRDRCYEKLQINRPEIIIDGVDYLAQMCDLELTERTFKETNFDYLEPK